MQHSCGYGKCRHMAMHAQFIHVCVCVCVCACVRACVCAYICVAYFPNFVSGWGVSPLIMLLFFRSFRSNNCLSSTLCHVMSLSTSL